MQMNETSDTYVILHNVLPNHFIFSVAAINVLGKGEERNIMSEFHTQHNEYIHSPFINNEITNIHYF